MSRARAAGSRGAPRVPGGRGGRAAARACARSTAGTAARRPARGAAGTWTCSARAARTSRRPGTSLDPCGTNMILKQNRSKHIDGAGSKDKNIYKKKIKCSFYYV